MNDTKQNSVRIYRILSDSARNTKIGEKSRIKIYSETNDEKLFKDFERHFRTCKSWNAVLKSIHTSDLHRGVQF